MILEPSNRPFDAHPEAFGSADVRQRLADGRYGPVFLAHDRDTDAVVVVRTFGEDLTSDQRDLLLDALQRACEAPLLHASIGRPIRAGIENNRVYVIHTFLAGQSADEWLNEHGRRSADELLPSIASAAAAVDFAAAAGVHHGALTTADLIIDGDTAGVTGWGIEQARAVAGLTQDTPSHAADIAAFVTAVLALVIVPPAVDAAGHRYASALEFAAALQDAVVGQDAAAAAPEPFEPPLHADAFPVTHAFEPDVDVAVDRAPVIFDESPVFTSEASVAPAPRESRGPRWLAFAAVAVMMLAVGFAGGLVTGRQGMITAPAASPPAVAAATSGHAFTDEPVIQPQIRTPDDASPTPPDATPQVAPQPATTPIPVRRPETPREVTPASDSEAILQVDSRPRGAQVYVDGRLIGHTPVLAGGMRPGPHMVRLAMSGYHPWATAVTLSAGEHAHIGGSLEQ